MSDTEHEEIKGLIKEMEKRFDDRLDRFECAISDTLKETTTDTKENTKHIERILMRLEASEKDINDIGIQNRDQHKEFYSRYTSGFICLFL